MQHQYHDDDIDSVASFDSFDSPLDINILYPVSYLAKKENFELYENYNREYVLQIKNVNDIEIMFNLMILDFEWNSSTCNFYFITSNFLILSVKLLQLELIM